MRVKELKFVKKVVVETADAEIAAAGVDPKYEVGTMIETPVLLLQLTKSLQRLNFLFRYKRPTQMTFGFSRDDTGKFLNAYYDTKILKTIRLQSSTRQARCL